MIFSRRFRLPTRSACGTMIQTSNPQTYLKSTATGAPTFGGVASFASNEYTWNQTHMSNAVSLKSDTKGVFDFDLSASSYNYLQDIELNPYTVTSTGIGYLAKRQDHPQRRNQLAKRRCRFIWRPFGFDGPHEISYGIHGDRYYFDNPVYASSVWNNSIDRHRSDSIRTGSAKPAPARCGRRTPGSLRRAGSLRSADGWKTGARPTASTSIRSQVRRRRHHLDDTP